MTTAAPPDLAEPTPKPRHGSEKRQRSTTIQVRVLPQQQERLRADAAAARMSVPGYLLAGRLGEDTAPPRRRPAAAVTVEAEALARAVVAFSRGNNNLNQLAHNANRLLLIAEERGSGELAGEARELARAVDAVRAEMRPVFADILAALKACS